MLTIGRKHPDPVFFSYARDDQQYVKPIVAVLRSNDRPVFFDLDSIEPGTKWEEALESAVESCSKMMVFWSCNSARSEWVEREWRTAHRKDKPLIPVILDQTPMPDELNAFQWIDFRVFPQDSSSPSNKDDTPVRRMGRLAFSTAPSESDSRVLNAASEIAFAITGDISLHPYASR